MENIKNDSRSEIILENLSKKTPKLNEDLTVSIVSRISKQKKREKQYKFINFIRIYSSAAVVFIIIAFSFTKKPVEEKYTGEQQNTKIQITTATKEAYISYLQNNTQKNRENIQKKKQLKN
ncbi:MAG: hypothetical protein LBS07_04780 [Prevotellaceae bacterium]|jgi:hypothetical protein|nr:hypothetical protein [Prevotellaceae bacterium]